MTYSVRSRARCQLFSLALWLLAAINAVLSEEPVSQADAITHLRERGVQVHETLVGGKNKVGIIFLFGHGDSELKYVAKVSELRFLSFSFSSVTDDGMANVAGLTNLECLVLAPTELTDGALQHIVKLPNLWMLQLSQHMTDEALRTVGQMQQLRSLGIYGETMTDEGLKHLGSLRDLTSISLTSPNITQEGLRYLKPLKKLAGLQPPVSINDQGLSYIVDFPLTSLQLSRMYRNITNEGLAHVGRISTLRSLQLPPQITDEGFKRLAGLTQIQQLNLWETGVTDAGLSVLRNMKQVSSIQLPREASDHGLANLVEMKRLISICAHERIGDGSIVYLKKLTNLKTLKLPHNTRFTKAGMDELRRHFPRLRIDVGPPPVKVP